MKSCRPAHYLKRGMLLIAAGSLLARHASAGGADSVLGRAGDIKILMSDVDATLATLDARERDAVKADGSRLDAIVRSLLIQRLVLRDAEAVKWDKEPGVVEQLARVRESALVDSFLTARARPEDRYPSEAEVKSAYEASRSALLVPRTYLVAQIFISAPKGNPDASKEKAAAKKLARVRELLARAGADFSAIAKAESEDAASAAQGGEIGWLAEEQIQPEIRTQLPKLRINALSEPLRLDDGWHIIKVLDVREAHTPLLEQVRTQLVQQLRSERERQNREAYISKLLEASPLAINEATLSELNAKKAK